MSNNWLFDPNKCPPHNAEAPITSFVDDPTVPDAPDTSAFDVPDLDSNFPNTNIDDPAGFPRQQCPWLVVNCATGETKLIDGDLDRHVTRVVTFDTLPGCWRVVGQACQIGAKPEEADVTGSHKNCAECNNCFDLKHCDGPETMVARGNLADHVGKVVRFFGEQPEKCWEVRRGDTCKDAKDVWVGESYHACDTCTLYKIRSCDDPTWEVVTPTNLAEAVGTTPDDLINNPQVFQFDVLPGCWKPVAHGKNLANPADFFWLTIIDVMDTCEECICYILTDCWDREQRYKAVSLKLPDGNFANLDDYISRVVRLSNGGCYEVNKVAADDCPDGMPLLKNLTITTDHDECDHCVIARMTPCDDPGTVVPVYSDLGRYGPPRFGAVFVDEDGRCWQITSFGGSYDQAVAKKFTAYLGDHNCPDCTKVYQLRDVCQPSWCKDPITTDLAVQDARLSPVVGKYIRIDGRCYLVEGETSVSADLTTPDWEGPFDDCDSCKKGSETTVTLLADVCTSGGVWKKVPVTLRGQFEVCFGKCEDVVDCTTECRDDSGTTTYYLFDTKYDSSCGTTSVTQCVDITNGVVPSTGKVYKLPDGGCYGYSGNTCTGPPDQSGPITEYADCSSCTGTGGGGGSGVNCGPCTDIPASLTATLVWDGPSGDPCSCLGSISINLTYDSAQGKWTGSASSGCGTVYAEMHCDTPTNELIFLWGCGGSYQGTALTINQCTPFDAYGTTGVDYDCCAGTGTVHVSVIS